MIRSLEQIPFMYHTTTEPSIPKWIELSPGANHEYNINVYIRAKGKQKLPCRGEDENISIILETFDMLCGVEKAGEFKVYAMVEQQPLTESNWNN